jgi:hypothetical protein
MPIIRVALDIPLATLFDCMVAARDVAAWQRITEVKQPEPHPLFVVVQGEVEDWEVR